MSRRFLAQPRPDRRIAVGTPVTGHPPHRSRRAQFTHRAPTSGKDGRVACRTRSSPWDTLSRLSVRRVRGLTAFPSAPSLRSTDSAPGCPGLFPGFFATMERSDFSRPCIIGYGSSPSRCGPPGRDWPSERSPGSRARSVRACQGLTTTQGRRALALARPSVLPSATDSVGTRMIVLSRLNGWPARTPVNAS